RSRSVSGWATVTTRTRRRPGLRSRSRRPLRCGGHSSAASHARGRAPASPGPAIPLVAAAPVWGAFVRDVSASMPVAGFPVPKGLVAATIDAWSGGRPGPWTRDRTREWFIDGTQPGARHAIDPDGLLYTAACGGWRVDPLKAELGPRSWDTDVANWLYRARRGTGVEGRFDSRTAFFWGKSSWGGTLMGTCYKPKPKPPKEAAPPSVPPGHGGAAPGHGGGGGGEPAPTPHPPPRSAGTQ